MAITVHLYYVGENGSAERFAKEMMDSGTVEKIRAEKGNLRYEYFFSTEDRETVLLIDSWADREVLNRHHKSDMMKTMINLREKYDLHMRVERYVPDETSLDTDKKYFRK